MPSESIAELPAVFTHAEASARGVGDRQLYGWRDDGTLEQLARGIFVRPGLAVNPDLLEIAVRAPEATVCLTSALARHGLVDDIPAVIDIALPRRRRAPRTAAPVRWHRFDEHTFAIDRNVVPLASGYSVGLYGPARCVVDAFRLRHLYGQDQAVESLRRWLRRRGSHPADLLSLAAQFPAAEPPLRKALEILL